MTFVLMALVGAFVVSAIVGAAVHVWLRRTPKPSDDRSFFTVRKNSHGQWTLHGSFMPIDAIRPRQRWTATDDSGHTVMVLAVRGSEVTYRAVSALGPTHTKDQFSFQVRYCLVLL